MPGFWSTFPSFRARRRAQARPAAARRGRGWGAWPLLWLLVLAGAGAAVVGTLAERAGEARLAAVGSERLALYAATLEAELARFSPLPGLMAALPEVQELIGAPADPALRRAADRALARVAARGGAGEAWLVSPVGEPWATSVGPVAPGQVLPDALRRALAEERADLFLPDPLLGSTQYQFLHPVRRGERIVAWLLLGVSLAPLEATWTDLSLRAQSERLLVLDGSGRVILSSQPAWRQRHLRPWPSMVPPPPAASLAASAPLDAASAPLDLPLLREVEPGVRLVDVPADLAGPGASATGGAAGPLLAQEQLIVPLGLRIIALSDPADVRRGARQAAWGGAAGGALLGLGVAYLLQRRRALRQLTQAQDALQQAHDQLERQVDERTTELRETNTRLLREIAQREQAEHELLQASKLAVLGQLSAGISHEINQPLTALRALSGNSLRLLAAGRHGAVEGNLRSIDEMAERMGRIVAQLKSFARKEALSLQAVALDAVVHNVLLMLAHRLRPGAPEVLLQVPEGLCVRADMHRLEQVLLNLCANALDALEGRGAAGAPVGTEGAAGHTGPAPRVLLRAEPVGSGRVRVQVDDNGPGVDEAGLARLFEPFHTTKPAGQGLGLGLVISTKILRELGTTLRAERLAPGLRFEFELERAAPAHDAHV